MKRFGILALLCACGGTGTTDIDGGDVDSGGDSTTGNDSGGGGDSGGGSDSGGGKDGGVIGDGGCADFLTKTCDAGCPTNSVCVQKSLGPQTVDEGCYPTSDCASSTPKCECVGKCVCTDPGSVCQNKGAGVYCSGGTVSRREFKTDIDYVDDAERASLANQALHTRLAEYRYKTEPEGTQRHLGFIIDDMPTESPAVQSDKTHVDQYGYSSMLLAAVQEQQKQIDELKKQVDALTLSARLRTQQCK